VVDIRACLSESENTELRQGQPLVWLSAPLGMTLRTEFKKRTRMKIEEQKRVAEIPRGLR
jgi:hypothetical protein